VRVTGDGGPPGSPGRPALPASPGGASSPGTPSTPKRAASVSSSPRSTSYNVRHPSVKRILQEVRELAGEHGGLGASSASASASASSPGASGAAIFATSPLEDNLFEWLFAISGPPDSEFAGGVYLGRILLPPEYPMKPPAFVFLTPNGRFETGARVCLSISQHHPEEWQPSWGVRTALTALQAFLPTPGRGAVGSLDLKPEIRRKMAAKSREFDEVARLFPAGSEKLELAQDLWRQVHENTEAAEEVEETGEEGELGGGGGEGVPAEEPVEEPKEEPEEDAAGRVAEAGGAGAAAGEAELAAEAGGPDPPRAAEPLVAPEPPAAPVAQEPPASALPLPLVDVLLRLAALLVFVAALFPALRKLGALPPRGSATSSPGAEL